MSKKLEKSDSYSDAFNRLIDVCDKQSTSVTSLLDKFTTSRSAITAWKKGNINTDVLAKIATELDVSLDYLLNGKEKNSPAKGWTADEQELITYYKELDPIDKGRVLERARVLAEQSHEPEKKPESTIFIEYYSLPVSAGTGVYLDDCEREMIEVEDTPITNAANFALKVAGDSMEPVFHDGDLVLVESQPTVEIGEIGIFIVNNEGFIKKFGGDRLISLNPLYDDIILREYDDIYCRGKVIGAV